jgi:hypothetical protein
MSGIKTLVELANRPLLNGPIDPIISLPIPDHQKSQLLEMLTIKNGFYAFRAALHVFPIGRNSVYMDLVSWNEPELWKSSYEFLKDDIFCFAETILGDQYCVYKDGVGMFDPETGDIEYIADDIEGWAQALSTDARNTGYPWSEQWAEIHGSLLPAGHRLMMKRPGVCGGEYHGRNMRSVNAVDAMRYWGTFATLTQNVPLDGAVTIDLVKVLPDGTAVKVPFPGDESMG